ncbi:MAG: DNA polymerase/3'-5' exonuclease PolX [Candidatus Omnitrophica bacterium]|nr:DNA polymerase/3'-5' exonuclease PolX [Candidatus Omnitrophota bacterium]
MKNLLAADIFERIADLLELKGENPFRIQAYRRAALNLRNFTGDLEEMTAAGTLREIPGVGEDLAEKIREIVTTGRLAYLERIQHQVPAILSVLVTVPGVGPKTAQLIHRRFHLKSLDHLEQLIKAGKLRALPGMGRKKQENILRGIGIRRAGRERMPLGTAVAVGRQFVRALEKFPEVRRISTAGSLRRRKETVRDIDILITSTHPKKVMDRFVTLPLAAHVQAHGETKSSIRTAQGLQVDLRVVEPESFGAALVYFTGSKEHNIKIRGLANRKGLTVNEYGVFRLKGNRRVAGKEEEDVYRALGMRWMPPEIREDLGEVELAQKGKLPALVERKHIRGSFHNHTKRSDGSHTLEELTEALRKDGYDYMVLSDHSQSLRIANGLSESELLKEAEEVRRFNKRSGKFRVLMGAEVDILPDGRLDYPDRVLAKLDVVIAAVHSAFRQPKEVMTQRIVKAIGNPHVDILAHPTGRLIGERDPYQVDLDDVYRAAAKSRTALEINSHTLRLDLNDAQARRAREKGAKLVIGHDTHVLDQLTDIDLGLSMARRAWLGPGDILNSLSADELLSWVKQKRPI